MTTLGDLGKIVADEIKLVRGEAEAVEIRTDDRIGNIDSKLSGSIETDLSDHENKLRNHEGKIESILTRTTKTERDLFQISNDFNARVGTIEAKIITIETKQQKFDNISKGLFNYFAALRELDPNNSNLASLVATLSENN